MKEKSKNNKDKTEQEVATEFDIDFLEQALNNNQALNSKPIDSFKLDNPEKEDNSNSSTNNSSPTITDENGDVVEQSIIEKRQAYSKLSLEDKFKKARRTKWCKSLKWKLAWVYFFPVHKKERIRQIKQIFVRRFNEYFGTSFRIDTLGTQFNLYWQRYVDTKAFAIAVRIWIVIVAIIVLPIALYFIITASKK